VLDQADIVDHYDLESVIEADRIARLMADAVVDNHLARTA
jgi:hypothetical protein